MTKVLVVRQPYAFLIVSGKKDIENRSLKTHHRGPILVQASHHRPTRREWQEAVEFCRARGVELPAPESLPYGGIVGQVDIIDCVRASDSVWFEGPVGWRLAGGHTLPFVAMKGQLGVFTAPAHVAEMLGCGAQMELALST